MTQPYQPFDKGSGPEEVLKYVLSLKPMYLIVNGRTSVNINLWEIPVEDDVSGLEQAIRAGKVEQYEDSKRRVTPGRDEAAFPNMEGLYQYTRSSLYPIRPEVVTFLHWPGIQNKDLRDVWDTLRQAMVGRQMTDDRIAKPGLGSNFPIFDDVDAQAKRLAPDFVIEMKTWFFRNNEWNTDNSQLRMEKCMEFVMFLLLMSNLEYIAEDAYQESEEE